LIEPEPLLRNVEPNVALHSHIKRLGDELYGLCGGQLRINSQCFVDERVGRWKLNPHNQSHPGCVWCGTTQKVMRDEKMEAATRRSSSARKKETGEGCHGLPSFCFPYFLGSQAKTNSRRDWAASFPLSSITPIGVSMTPFAETQRTQGTKTRGKRACRTLNCVCLGLKVEYFVK